MNPKKYDQTSSGIESDVVFDRESGKPIVIQYPSFNLVMSEASLSFKTNWQGLSTDRIMLLLKCLILIHILPENALREAVEELEGIAQFYADLPSQKNFSVMPATNIKGELETTKIRPTLALDQS